MPFPYTVYDQMCTLAQHQGVEPGEKNIMSRKPRDRKQRIINKNMIFRLLMIGAVLGSGSLFLFYKTISSFGLTPFSDGLVSTYAYVKATTVVFVSLILFQMVNVFNCRSEKESAYSINLFSNKFLIFSVSSSLLLMLSFVYIPFFNDILHTTPLLISDWILIGMVALTINFADEIRKYVIRKNEF